MPAAGTPNGLPTRRSIFERHASSQPSMGGMEHHGVDWLVGHQLAFINLVYITDRNLSSRLRLGPGTSVLKMP